MVRRSLNSYVHPNYGSHIAALFPERGTAARLLLEAVVAVYDGFFALSWAEHPVYGPTAPTDIGPLESWPSTIKRLQSQTLPEVQRTAGDPVLAKMMQRGARDDRHGNRSPGSRHFERLERSRGLFRLR
jgi:hypothetical protein